MNRKGEKIFFVGVEISSNVLPGLALIVHVCGATHDLGVTVVGDVAIPLDWPSDFSSPYDWSLDSRERSAYEEIILALLIKI